LGKSLISKKFLELAFDIMKPIYSSYDLAHKGGYDTRMHRFYPHEGRGIPILLLHGSIEDSRIFYSSSGKGFAPFLAQKGFDVFIPDLPGKGKSSPRASRNFDHSMQTCIDRDIPDYLDYIRKFYPDEQIRIGAHSWGGVIILAWYAKYGESQNIGPMVFFGTKRRIGILTPYRLFAVDLIWTIVGSVATALLGYLPAKTMRIGSDNEPRTYYFQTNRWVYSRKWKDIVSGEDLSILLTNKSIPDLLFYAGINDHFLGHPKDVKRLIEEVGSSNYELVLLSKQNGHMKDYGHIDMLTAKECRNDHFPYAADWLLRKT
jgi:pimeloyl-ACP methyl ester carboxylesterase